MTGEKLKPNKEDTRSHYEQLIDEIYGGYDEDRRVSNRQHANREQSSGSLNTNKSTKNASSKVGDEKSPVNDTNFSAIGSLFVGGLLCCGIVGYLANKYLGLLAAIIIIIILVVLFVYAGYNLLKKNPTSSRSSQPQNDGSRGESFRKNQ